VKKAVLFSLVSLLALSTWAANYKLDEAHTSVAFKIKHLVISTVSGRFDKFSGGFDFDPAKGEISKLTVEIDPSSIDTNEPDRDKHLRSPDFFDVAKFPKLTFVSTKTVVKNKKPVQLEGDLTIHGVTKHVKLDLDYAGTTTDPWGNERLAFEATAKIDRKDYGLTWNKKLDKGGVMVADEVKIEISGEAVLQKTDQK
jgi:polyisoprenoid-binding protein YceI